MVHGNRQEAAQQSPSSSSAGALFGGRLSRHGLSGMLCGWWAHLASGRQSFPGLWGSSVSAGLLIFPTPFPLPFILSLRGYSISAQTSPWPWSPGSPGSTVSSAANCLISEVALLTGVTQLCLLVSLGVPMNSLQMPLGGFIR